MVVVLCEQPRYAFIHVPKSGGTFASTARLQRARAFKLPMVEHDLPLHADWRQIHTRQGQDWMDGAGDVRADKILFLEHLDEAFLFDMKAHPGAMTKADEQFD